MLKNDTISIAGHRIISDSNIFLLILFWELIVAHLVKNVSSFYGFKRMNVVYTKSREADIKQKKKCSSYITETHLHVTDTQVNLTLDKGYNRVIPREIKYEQRVHRNKNECKEYRVEIQVSLICVVTFGSL